MEPNPDFLNYFGVGVLVLGSLFYGVKAIEGVIKYIDNRVDKKKMSSLEKSVSGLEE